jgi:nicotinamidase-related amidase
MNISGSLPRSRQVLLLVDFINPLDFPGAENLAGPAVEAARATARLRRSLDREGVTTVYANDNFGRWHSDFPHLVDKLLAGGGPSARIARLLKPRHRDVAILKPRHSAFFASPLQVLLEAIGAKHIVLAGLATDMCVQLTAAEGFLRGYRMSVPANCTAAESEAAKAASLEYMARILKCDVRDR